MDRFIFYAEEFKIFLFGHKWALLVLIFVVTIPLTNILHTSRCIVVDVVGFTTNETNEGTQVLALFEKNGVVQRFKIPRKSAVEKGMVAIVEKENIVWGSSAYLYDSFSFCSHE